MPLCIGISSSGVSQRASTALVRLVVQSGGKDDQLATAVATGFAQKLYPVLREILPR